MIAVIFKALKGLLSIQGGAAWLALVPGVGPIVGIAVAAFGFVVQLVKWFVDGVTVILANPVTLVSVAIIAAASLGYGVHAGIKLDGNRAVAAVVACNIRVGEIETTHNAVVAKAVEEAIRAAAMVPETPVGNAELVALCKASASCRSRGAL